MKSIVREHIGREQSFAIGQTHMRGRLPAVNQSDVGIAIIFLTLALASVNATAQSVPPGCDSPVSGIAQKNPGDHKCGVLGSASFRGLLKHSVKNNFLVPGGPPVGMALSALARVHKAVEQPKIQSGSGATLSTDRNVLEKTGVELGHRSFGQGVLGRLAGAMAGKHDSAPAEHETANSRSQEADNGGVAQAAKKLGISAKTLSHYVAAKKVLSKTLSGSASCCPRSPTEATRVIKRSGRSNRRQALSTKTTQEK